jgi:hypothetical protein
MDEFGPLNLMPHPGRQWAERGGRHKGPNREPRRRWRATYNRYGGVRHLFAALDLAKDKLYGHIKPAHPVPGVLPLPALALPTDGADRDRLRQLLTPPDHEEVPAGRHLGGSEQRRNRLHPYSWLNRIEAQFTALRYFALDGTDHASHKEQGSMIRRYIIWRNKHTADIRLRTIVTRVNVA